ncbi:entericidin A/B family lipoprotein [Elstera litoralis]|uniref:entericidin A/B family lipoprotein n=1 Tax=Elstera litoralis TaxID=552518 RepID=UPI000A0445A7|nr:entericidin A/B family lipoprotein [Elstera litoralis]
MTQVKPKTLLLLATLLAGTALLAACNTVAGAGQDMQQGGKAIEKSADKHAP